MDAIIRYTHKILLWKMVLGIASVVFSVYGIIFYGFSSIIFLGLSVVLLNTEGVDIDLASKTYRTTFSILGLKIGKWRDLPQIEYVSVFATTESTRVWASSASGIVKDDVVLINMFYNRNKKIEVYKSYDVDDAFEVAFHYSDALIVDLLDSTRANDYRWVDKNIYRETMKIVHLD